MKPSSQSRLNATGLLCAFGAYGLWGLFPPFFGALQPATAPEIMAHRIIWTFVFMAAVIAVRGVGEVLAIRPRTWLLLVCASALISCNWLLYVYAVNSGHVVDTAFGYFVNPLVSVFLGVVLFGERLNRAQSLALSIALAAVIVLSLDLHGRPLIALGLAVSFALYGAVKKVVPTDPRVSVGVEAALATPFAAAYLIWLHIGGHAQFLNHGPAHAVLLLLCGPVTAIPLLLFAAATHRLPLVTIGLIQYLTPSMLMAWGVLIGHEEMPPARWLGFGLIWTALAIFSFDALSRGYRSRTRVPAG
ncbi:MAG: EamA family transporter RarD [Mycobacterium sp.]|nr:EamA family transporter RarD [Mycobacterium sp.]